MAIGKNAKVCPAEGTAVGLGGIGVSDVAPLLARESASMTHLRTMFAFKPLAIATAAINAPGCRHSSTTPALNLGGMPTPCLPARQFNLGSVQVSAMQLRGHKHPLPAGAIQDGFAGRLPPSV